MSRFRAPAWLRCRIIVWRDSRWGRPWTCMFFYQVTSVESTARTRPGYRICSMWIPIRSWVANGNRLSKLNWSFSLTEKFRPFRTISRRLFQLLNFPTVHAASDVCPKSKIFWWFILCRENFQSLQLRFSFWISTLDFWWIIFCGPFENWCLCIIR